MLPRWREDRRALRPMAAIITTNGVSIVTTVQELTMEGVTPAEATCLQLGDDVLVTLRHFHAIARPVVTARGAVVRSRGVMTVLFREVCGARSRDNLRRLVNASRAERSETGDEGEARWNARSEG